MSEKPATGTSLHLPSLTTAMILMACGKQKHTLQAPKRARSRVVAKPDICFFWRFHFYGNGVNQMDLRWGKIGFPKFNTYCGRRLTLYPLPAKKAFSFSMTWSIV